MNLKLNSYKSASSSDVARVEAELGIAFPAEYRDFVSEYDGAIPEENVFESDENININRFIPISEIGKLASGIDGMTQDVFPIAEAPSGNYVYLKGDDHSVWFWDHEIEGGDKKLAINFKKFMQKLTPFDKSAIQLQPRQVKSVWVDPGFKPEF